MGQGTAASAQAALRALREHPGPDARRAVIEAHLPLVDSVARRFASSAEPHDDLVQAGRVGLIKAVDRYEPERGDLTRFAVPFIRGEIHHHLRDRTGAVRTPRPVRELGVRARAAQDDLAARRGRAPSPADVAEAVGRSTSDVQQALAALVAATAVSLPDEAGDGAGDDRDVHMLVELALAELPERDRRIVELRYFDDRPQIDIAREVGLSPASVSRILQSSLARLRRALEGDGPVERSPEAAYADEEMAMPATSRSEADAARSGRVLVRMPQTLHDELAEAAEREGVSLNTFITSALAASVRWRDAGGAEPEAEPRAASPAPQRSRWAAYAVAANVVLVALAVIVAVVLLAGALG